MIQISRHLVLSEEKLVEKYVIYSKNNINSQQTNKVDPPPPQYLARRAQKGSCLQGSGAGCKQSIPSVPENWDLLFPWRNRTQSLADAGNITRERHQNRKFWELFWEARVFKSEVVQSCQTLCDHHPPPPMDYSLPGSSIHGIFQARILGWVAISFFPTRGSNLGLPHCR